MASNKNCRLQKIKWLAISTKLNPANIVDNVRKMTTKISKCIEDVLLLAIKYKNCFKKPC